MFQVNDSFINLNQLLTAMFSEDKVTEIFCLADEFCKFFDAQQEKSMPSQAQPHEQCRDNHNPSGGFRCFKHYYLHYICKHCTHLFPGTVSYNRFVEYEELTYEHYRQICLKEAYIHRNGQ